MLLGSSRSFNAYVKYYLTNVWSLFLLNTSQKSCITNHLIGSFKVETLV